LSEEDHLTVKGVGGVAVTNRIGNIPFFGKAYVIKDDNVNVLSLSLVEDMYPVTYTTKKEFVVHVNKDVDVKFERLTNNLWGCNFVKLLSVLKNREYDAVANLMETVAEREERYSLVEVKRARQARDIMKQLGYPSKS
jgi:hypothetical protein